MANVNGVQVSGALASASPVVQAVGSDTNIDLQLQGQGSGVTRLGLLGAVAAVAGAATSNTQRGTVTSEALTTAAGADYSLVLTNNRVSATSVVMVSLDNGTNTILPIYVSLVTPGAGTVTIKVRNGHSATALNGTVKVSFVVL